MDKSRPGLLNIFIILMVINAVVTAVHYILIYKGVIPMKASYMPTVKEFAIADTIATTIPSIIAAFGLWRLNAWGWALAMLLGDGYLHGMIVLLIQGAPGAMNYVTIYFLLFTVLMVAYLWQQRKLFD